MLVELFDGSESAHAATGRAAVEPFMERPDVRDDASEARS